MKDADAQRCAIFAYAREKLRMLSADERVSLCEVDKGLLARTIPAAHQDALIAAELGKHALGGFMLTDLGKVAAGIARE